MPSLFLCAMKAKHIILFILLLMPVFIYVFLKMFGKNTYEIPIYFSEGVNSDYCGLLTTVPYTLDVDRITLFYAHSAKNEHIQTILREMVRIKSKTDIQIIGLEDLNEEKIPDATGVSYVGMLPNELVDFLSCKILVYSESSDVYNYLVLVDINGAIRGYYNAGDFAEYDRLFAEIDILQTIR